jgi:hypothetical protein
MKKVVKTSIEKRRVHIQESYADYSPKINAVILLVLLHMQIIVLKQMQ